MNRRRIRRAEFLSLFCRTDSLLARLLSHHVHNLTECVRVCVASCRRWAIHMFIFSLFEFPRSWDSSLVAHVFEVLSVCRKKIIDEPRMCSLRGLPTAVHVHKNIRSHRGHDSSRLRTCRMCIQRLITRSLYFDLLLETTIIRNTIRPDWWLVCDRQSTSARGSRKDETQRKCRSMYSHAYS